MSVYTAAVITVSDRGFAGERRDTAGPACIRLLKEIGFETVYTALVPDETDCIKRELLHCVDELDISLVLTCGGTGFSKRDVSPEAAEAVFDRRADGFAEAMRAESLRITPKAALSRAVSGLRNESIIITLPGSEKAAVENLSAVKLSLKHGVDMARSSGSADCAGREKSSPEISRWLSEAKSAARAADCGMYLIHNGVVRSSSKRSSRRGEISQGLGHGAFIRQGEAGAFSQRG